MVVYNLKNINRKYQACIYISHISALVQGSINSIANALELLQSTTKPWIYEYPRERGMQ